MRLAKNAMARFGLRPKTIFAVLAALIFSLSVSQGQQTINICLSTTYEPAQSLRASLSAEARRGFTCVFSPSAFFFVCCSQNGSPPPGIGSQKITHSTNSISLHNTDNLISYLSRSFLQEWIDAKPGGGFLMNNQTYRFNFTYAEDNSNQTRMIGNYRRFINTTSCDFLFGPQQSDFSVHNCYHFMISYLFPFPLGYGPDESRASSSQVLSGLC
jgi:hypothetical protein